MSEKTEQPSPKRLREAREKGDVAKSTEIVSAATVVAVIGYFIGQSASLFSEVASTVDYTLKNAVALKYDEALRLISSQVVQMSISIALPIVCLVIIVALISIFAQVGILFAPKAAAPKLENLNPARWFKQVFSAKNLFEFVKNIIKVVVLGLAVYLSVKGLLVDMFSVPNSNMSSMWTVLGELLRVVSVYAVCAFVILACLDFLYVKFKYNKDHMMSIEEVKQEFKQSEGDPHIKQKRKQLHQEMMNQSTIANTRKAKVLVVNPTHYAVAIGFEPGVDKLPYVLAKGQGEMARRMIETAKEENIPIMRNVPLARALYADSYEGVQVPTDLLVPVAEVLKVVLQMQQQ